MTIIIIVIIFILLLLIIIIVIIVIMNIIIIFLKNVSYLQRMLLGYVRWQVGTWSEWVKQGLPCCDPYWASWASGRDAGIRHWDMRIFDSYHDGNECDIPWTLGSEFWRSEDRGRVMSKCHTVVNKILMSTPRPPHLRSQAHGNPWAPCGNGGHRLQVGWGWEGWAVGISGKFVAWIFSIFRIWIHFHQWK